MKVYRVKCNGEVLFAVVAESVENAKRLMAVRIQSLGLSIPPGGLTLDPLGRVEDQGPEVVVRGESPA